MLHRFSRWLGGLPRVALLAACLALLTPLPYGGPASAATVGAIAVEGNERIDDETIRTYVTIRPGRSFGAEDVDQSLRALFDTGLFSDVQITQRGGTLVVTVVENPVINRIAFEGNSKLKDDQLAGVVLSKERGVYSRTQAQIDAQRLLEAYRQAGQFQASVTPQVIDLPQNRVNLVFEITEGPRTRVSRINFIGNRAFSDSRLRDVIASREAGGLLGFLRSSNTYDPQKVSSDEDRLRRFYQDRGYADFQIVSSVVDLDRERNSFFITFTVDEGQRYRFGEVSVDSIIPGIDAASLRRQVESRPGTTYSADDVADSAESLTRSLATSGYAFAQVTPRLERRPETGTIDVVYIVDEGTRAYIERIEIRGNTRTRDYVIRREFDIVEGDAYNRVLVDAAERRLRNLGYFSDVRVSTAQGSQPDRVVVNVDVTEQPTGELSFGAGYSTSDGILGDLTLTERNFLGRGYGLRLAVGGGESTRTYEFGFTDPYFLGRRISAGFNVYRREYGEDDDRNYELETTGGTIALGFPLTSDLTFTTGYRLEENDISVDVPETDFNGDGVIDIQDRVLDLGNPVSQAVIDNAGSTITSAVNYAFIYNTLDSSKDPREGFYARVGQEFAGVGGDVNYLKTTALAAAYRPVLEDYDVIGMLKGQTGHVMGTNGDLRLADHFFQGASLVRGFKGSGLGPRDFFTGDALGGTFFVGGTAELQFPFPVIPREFGFRAALFADAGTLVNTEVDTGDLNLDGVIDSRVYTTGPNAPPPGALAGIRDVTVVGDDGSIRSSVGASVLWASPIGPLRVDFAQVLSESDEKLINGENVDQTQWFRFGGGTRF